MKNLLLVIWLLCWPLVSALVDLMDAKARQLLGRAAVSNNAYLINELFHLVWYWVGCAYLIASS